MTATTLNSINNGHKITSENNRTLQKTKTTTSFRSLPQHRPFSQAIGLSDIPIINSSSTPTTAITHSTSQRHLICQLQTKNLLSCLHPAITTKAFSQSRHHKEKMSFNRRCDKSSNTLPILCHQRPLDSYSTSRQHIITQNASRHSLRRSSSEIYNFNPRLTDVILASTNACGSEFPSKIHRRLNFGPSKNRTLSIAKVLRWTYDGNYDGGNKWDFCNGPRAFGDLGTGVHPILVT